MLTTKGNDFYLDDKKIKIYSGAVHYFRSMPEYWEDVLTKLKLCGFNTVETYVCWNLHEKQEGEFDFDGILDIKRFLKTAQKVGLYAIVRPGPYICAEWNFGALPAWLLKDKNMRIRCMYEPYLKACKRFYKRLFEEIGDMQYSNGGNIIAMQIENEYGSYGNDKEYLNFIKDLMLDCGCTEFMFTSDGAEDNMLSGGMLDSVLAVANFGSKVSQNFKKLREYQPEGPLMCGEFWNGWFDRWDTKEKHHTRPVSEIELELKSFLKQDTNFNFYMFYGGTNFGFNSGANYYGEFQPTITSYDDDALLNEWGGYTPKYHAVRKILCAHQGIDLVELPEEPQLQKVGRIELKKKASLIKNLDKLTLKKIQSPTPESMEHFGLCDGFILYETTVKGNYSGKLWLDGLRDRAHVFVNDELKGIVYRNDKEQSISLGKLTGENNIKVLVEDMGRINYGPNMMDRKGVEQIRIDGQLLFGYNVYLIPLENIPELDETDGKNEFPCFFKGNFTAEKDKSCFVHLSGFTKGYVFVNGFNLGRYWKIGPQKSLYIPGALLKEENEITVLELDHSVTDVVYLLDEHDIGQKKKLF